MPPKVLVVEDDAAIRDYCRTVLLGAGLGVDACDTAAEGRTLFNAGRPDLAVLDIGLPDANGLDLMGEWHSYPGPKVPVIFLTARGDLPTRLECFRRGAQDYVHKPFSAEELLARVRVHLSLKQAHDELARKNYELELLARARQDMTDMIVHDLKTPLTAIKGTLELIRAHKLITSVQHATLLDHAGSAADFMLLMLNDLLDVSRAREAGLKAEPGPLEAGALFDKLHALFADRSRKTGVGLAWSALPGAQRLTGDPTLVYRVLVNLISNAIAASPRDALVEVECSRRGPAARFCVSDRGRGVPAAEKEAIFEKYETGRSGKALDTGSGIGLTFCRAAAQAMGGRVWVEDRPGGGSTFILEFPQPAS